MHINVLYVGAQFMFYLASFGVAIEVWSLGSAIWGYLYSLFSINIVVENVLDCFTL